MRRWLLIVLAVGVLLAGGTLLGFRLAVHVVKGRLVTALGAGSEVRELNVGLSSLELKGLSVPGPKGWPAARSLHAERVLIVPQLRTLLTDEVQIASVTIVKPYLSVLRTKDKIQWTPTILENAGPKKEKAAKEERLPRSVKISRVNLEDGVVELFDTTVARPALEIRFERVDVDVRDVVAPSFQGRTQFTVSAVVKGLKRDGRAKVSGWVDSGGKDSSSHIVLESVDLVSIQPYLVKSGDARVSRGILDLELKSEVRKNQLDGRGHLVIKDLEFAPASGYRDTFMGVPRQAVISFLKNHQGAIDVSFTLQGDIGSPNFSLNETIATRVASSLAGFLGVSIRGVAEGVEFLGRKSLEGAGSVLGTVGSAVKGILGTKEKN